MPGKVSRGETPPGNGRRPSLRREIALMLAVKVALLYGIWFLFFSEPQLKKMTEGMDPDRVAASIVSPTTTTRTPNP
ncbi:MAG: hypothetical protein KJ634_10865 [Gammaproteobacteria bacterium]|nr:hypothetical protein [Gammaproteobacteria bacterium]MBU1416113.1 hypothetical protein [Gammaproteobacteria bacterium]